MNTSAHRRRFWRLSACLVALGAIACAVDRIAAPSLFGEGQLVALEGRSTLLRATPDGLGHRDLGRWTTSATVRDGFARSAGDLRRQVAHLSAPGSIEAEAARGAASLIRVLGVRDDIRRSEPGRVLARSWNHEGAELTAGLLIGQSGLPETIVLFRGDVPVTLFRYGYTRERGGWRATSAATIVLDDEKPVLGLLATADGAQMAATDAGAELMSAAATIVANVRQSVAWRRLADAIVPPLHAEEEEACWREWVAYAAASAALLVAAAAVAAACGTMTPTCLAAIAAYVKAVEIWTDAMQRLFACYGFRLGDGGGGGGSSSYVYWNVPTAASIEEKIRAMDNDYPLMAI